MWLEGHLPVPPGRNNSHYPNEDKVSVPDPLWITSTVTQNEEGFGDSCDVPVSSKNSCRASYCIRATKLISFPPWPEWGNPSLDLGLLSSQGGQWVPSPYKLYWILFLWPTPRQPCQLTGVDDECVGLSMRVKSCSQYHRATNAKFKWPSVTRDTTMCPLTGTCM